MIKIQNVSKYFSGKKVLKQICLNLPSEKTHILLGSSGSGKSTLLKLIMGLEIADEGEIYIDDQLCDRVQSAGYVLQDGGLFPHMRVRENICLKAKLDGWNSSRIDNRIRELSDLIQFDVEWLDRFPRELSGGQRQRVSLLRALFLDPKILFLDEPLGALDPIVRSKLQKDLQSLFKKLRKTVVMVTHDLGEAAFIGDTISLFDDGQLIQHGELKDLLEHPAQDFVTDFITAQRTVF